MTWALCLNCGEKKFGAICPCPACQAESSGDINLDIAFSDHRMAVETIREFGEVIRAIRRVTDDDELRFWSFIAHVSSEHPEILRVDLSEEDAGRFAEVFAKANPPPVVVRDSPTYRMRREIEGRATET